MRVTGFYQESQACYECGKGWSSKDAGSVLQKDLIWNDSPRQKMTVSRIEPP